MALSTFRKELLDIYKCAVSSVEPDRLIEKALSFKDENMIIIEPDDTRTSINLRGKSLHIIGGGKSTLSMACGSASIAVRDHVAHLFSHGCLSLPVDQRSSFEKNKIEDLLAKVKVKCLFGSKNNLPDDDSVAASRSILAEISKACDAAEVSGKQPVFILLLSGGGSACLTSPKLLSLQEKLKLIKHLAQRGADIVELNRVRRCFSDIKGGRLAAHILRKCPTAQIVTLILSDIVGDPVDLIASGPTCIQDEQDISNQNSMLSAILKKYNYPDSQELVERRGNVNEELSKIITRHNLQSVIYNKVIGSNSIALTAGINKAKSYGYNVISMGNKIQGHTDEVIRHMLNLATGTSVVPGKTLIIGAGEATVNKKPDEQWGLGGRTQEMALDYLITMMNSSDDTEESVDLFIAASTDGQDGPTDVAACMASFSEIQTNKQKPFLVEDLISAKREHDSYNFWQAQKPEWLLRTGLTGTNVMDIYMLAKAKR